MRSCSVSRVQEWDRILRLDGTEKVPVAGAQEQGGGTREEHLRVIFLGSQGGKC